MQNENTRDGVENENDDKKKKVQIFKKLTNQEQLDK